MKSMLFLRQMCREYSIDFFSISKKVSAHRILKYLRACSKSTYKRTEIKHIAQQITVIVYPPHQPSHSGPHFTSPETRINTGFFPFVNFYGLPLTFTPAAVDTISRYFEETGSRPEDFDGIFTGDLGAEGYGIVKEQMGILGFDMTKNYHDCGLLIYDRKAQDTHAGGSGCGCGASVLAAHLIPKLQRRELRDILYIATGALMSPMTVFQGESIPGIAHLVRLTAERML